MDESTQPFKGEGPLGLAVQKQGLVPITNQPILRYIQVPGQRVDFYSREDKFHGFRGGFKIGEREFLRAALQYNNEVYLLTSRNEGGHGGYAHKKWLLRLGNPKNRVVIAEPHELTTMTYGTTDDGQVLLDTVYDGEANIPTAILREPMQTVGYKGHLMEAYARVRADELTGIVTQLAPLGTDVATEKLEDKVLISLTVPTTEVTDLIKFRKINSLKFGALLEAFQEQDLELVERINSQLDRDHACWGTASCIETYDFEYTEPRAYPTYRVSMDTQGNIYQAKRVAPSIEILSRAQR